MIHDKISSFIDNELGHEEEQEFLISLAARDDVRKAFRSELVLQKIMRNDEKTTAPPRRMRTAVFATLGLGAAATHATSASAASSSTAAQTASAGFVKSLFATKINALFTGLSIAASATVGYVGHSIVSDATTAPVTQSVVTEQKPIAAPTLRQQDQQQEPIMIEPKEEIATKKQPATRTRKSKSTSAVKETPSESMGTSVGLGSVELKPEINKKKSSETDGK